MTRRIYENIHLCILYYDYPISDDIKTEGWLAIPNRQNIKKYGWKKQVCNFSVLEPHHLFMRLVKTYCLLINKSVNLSSVEMVFREFNFLKFFFLLMTFFRFLEFPIFFF